MHDRLGRPAAATHAGLQQEGTAHSGLGVGRNIGIDPGYGLKMGFRPSNFVLQ